MPDGFALTEEQKKAFEDILSGPTSIKIDLLKQEKKFDAFTALVGSDRVLTDIRYKVPLDFKGTLLVSCDPANSKEVVVALTRFVLQAKSMPVLVLLNYNYKTMLAELKENSVLRGFVIIDTVSKSVSHVTDSGELIFIDSILNLTQLEIKMINLIDSNPNISFVFDSLGMLNLYHEKEVVVKFVYSVTKLLHKRNISGFFVSAGAPVQELTQFFDENIALKKFL